MNCAAAAASMFASGCAAHGQDAAPAAASYARREYWDARFETERAKDWLCTFADVRRIFEALVPDRGSRILLVGCGTSDLPADLFRAGYRRVLASDFSAKVVRRMAEHHTRLGLAGFVEADCLDLSAAFGPDSFDVILDKAAFDSVVSDGGGDAWTRRWPRRSCREGVCGSDGMNMNGKNGLACITPLSEVVKRKKLVLRPLPGLPVVRDLVVDMSQFYEQYSKVQPYLVNDNPPPESQEHLQSIEDREKKKSKKL